MSQKQKRMFSIWGILATVTVVIIAALVFLNGDETVSAQVPAQQMYSPMEMAQQMVDMTFAEIARLHEAGDYERIISQLKTSVETFADVPHMAFTMHYFLGRSYATYLDGAGALAAPEFEAALAQLQDGFIDDILGAGDVPVGHKLAIANAVGHAYYGAGRYQEAYDYYAWMLETFDYTDETASHIRACAYSQARAYGKLFEDDPESAALTYVDFANQYPMSSNAHDALRRASYHFEAANQPYNAIAQLARICGQYPNSRSGLEAYQRLLEHVENLPEPQMAQ